MSVKKERVDVLLVERGLIDTREKAKRSIMAGIVYSGDQRIDKPGIKLEIDKPLSIKGNAIPYVGRGGLKLEKAINEFHLNLQDKIVIDVGASTGGFTDCALQHGARLVYALDVGYNQLAWKLRQDTRVVVMERTNFRYVTPEQLHQGAPNFATIDVSFISLKLILPVLKQLLAKDNDVIALVKPQFEAGRAEVGKKGIVRDRAVHEKVLAEMIGFSIAEGFSVNNLSYSPITGGEGNIEFLLHLTYGALPDLGEKNLQQSRISEIVDLAHQKLK
jgi:23S rRNA (cytidine1920-2'-O)/16S rRNA (cytidine1409-2'-O)-methyltransferase